METTIYGVVISTICISSLVRSQIINEEDCKQKKNYEAQQIRTYDKIWKMMEFRLSVFEFKMKEDFEKFQNYVQDSLDQQASQLQSFDEQRQFMFSEINNISATIKDIESSITFFTDDWQKQHFSMENEMSNISTKLQDIRLLTLKFERETNDYYDNYTNNSLSSLRISLHSVQDECKTKLKNVETRLNESNNNAEKLKNNLSMIENNLQMSVAEVQRNCLKKINSTKTSITQVTQGLSSLNRTLSVKVRNTEKSLNILSLTLDSVEDGQRNCSMMIDSTNTHVSQVSQNLTVLSATFSKKVMNTEDSLKSLNSTIYSMSEEQGTCSSTINSTKTYIALVAKNISKNSDLLNQMFSNISIMESNFENTLHNTESMMALKVEGGINETKDALLIMQKKSNSFHEEYKAKMKNIEFRLNDDKVDSLTQKLSIIRDNLQSSVAEGQRNCTFKIDSTKTYISQLSQNLYTLNMTLSVKLTNTENTLNSLSSTLTSVPERQRDVSRTIESTEIYIDKVSHTLSVLNTTISMKVINNKNILNSLISTLHLVKEGQRNCTLTVNSTKADIAQLSQSLYALNLTLSMKVTNTKNSLNSFNSILHSVAEGQINCSRTIETTRKHIAKVSQNLAALNTTLSVRVINNENRQSNFSAALNSMAEGQSNCFRIINTTKTYINQVSQRLSVLNMTYLSNAQGTKKSLDALNSVINSVAESQRNLGRRINITKADAEQVSQSLSAINMTFSMKVLNTQNSLKSLRSIMNSTQQEISSLSRDVLINISRSTSSFQNSVKSLTNSDLRQNAQLANISTQHESIFTSITRLKDIMQSLRTPLPTLYRTFIPVPSTRTSTTTIATTTTSEFLLKVRLMDGGRSYGRVEVLYRGAWGTICNEGWSNNNARVVCAMLGYRTRNVFQNDRQITGLMWLSDVQCSGYERTLMDCRKIIGSFYCPTSENAGVSCY